MRISEQVVQKLLVLIQSSGLQSGQRLPAERALAEQMGVSRTSLREAIQQLSSQGILVSKVGAGTYLQTELNQWSQRAVDPLVMLMTADHKYRYDTLEARQALESSTAWHAAVRATQQDKDKIRSCFDRLIDFQQINDPDQSARADAQFHLAIAEASHNLVLVQVMRSLFDLVFSTVFENRRSIFLHDSPLAVSNLNRQHQELMQAIVDGDAPRAQNAIVEHLQYVRTTLLQADEDAARRERVARLTL